MKTASFHVCAVLASAMLLACGSDITRVTKDNEPDAGSGEAATSEPAVDVFEAGAGEATVVFEAGLGNDWRSWQPVANEVADKARVFAYSRPGYGESEPTDEPRDPAHIVEQLRALLKAREHAPPYVLVGHSFGGTYMELFAKAHPEEVSALVLVDPRHRDFTIECEKAGLEGCTIPDGVLASLPPVQIAEVQGFANASDEIFSASPNERYPKTDVHAHHVLQITLALTGRIDFEASSEHISGKAFAVAPDVPHTFEGSGLAAHLFVASDGRAGREIARVLCAKGPISPIPSELLGDFRARLRTAFEANSGDDDELRALGKSLIAQLAGQAEPTCALDPRVAKVIAWVAARLDQTLSLRDVTALVGLSPDRTRHLFVEQIGLSVRTYLLWLRLERAVELFAGGASLTAAAHSAGFADSAHLSRTFRRMFGISAASLIVS